MSKMFLVSLLIALEARAFVVPTDLCAANLAFVGTSTSQSSYYLIAPGVDPHYPNGQIATRYTFSLDSLVVDSTGEGADGIVEVSLPGGQIGDTLMTVPETPAISPGDRYAFAVRWISGRPEPLVLGWTYVPPHVALPSTPQLQTEWSAYCSARADDDLGPIFTRSE